MNTSVLSITFADFNAAVEPGSSMRTPMKTASSDSFFHLLSKLEPYYILAVIAIGLLGNSISLFVFLKSRLRQKTVNSILASLAITDNGFLLALLVVSVDHFNIDLFNNYSLVCKLNVYLNYVFSFLSSWFVVAFSVERFCVVYFPLKSLKRTRKENRNTKPILFLFLFAAVVYAYNLVISGLNTNPDGKAGGRHSTRCEVYEKWLELAKLGVLVDILVTMICPFLIISVLNFAIICKMVRRNKPLRRRYMSVLARLLALVGMRQSVRHVASPRRSHQSRMSHVSHASHVHMSFTAGGEPSTMSTVLRRNNSKTTKMLLVISSTFLLLNFPFAFIKVRLVVDTLFYAGAASNDPPSSDASGESSIDETLGKLSCYIYYLNFSVNFFLYSLYGSNFRRNFVKLVKK